MEAESNKEIRVLALSDHLGYADGRSHGGTTYFKSVFPELAGEGVRLTACFMAAPHPAADALRGRGVKTIFLNRHKFDPRVVPDVKKIIREEKIQILHLASYKSHFIGRLAALKRGVRTVVHFHDSVKMPFHIRLLQMSVSGKTDAAVAASKYIIDYAVKDYGLSSGIISVLNNPINIGEFNRPHPGFRDSLYRELGLSPEKKLIAVIGRLDIIKGQDHMIRAMPMILEKDESAVLLLAGEGRKYTEYRALAEKLGVSAAVRFAGHRNDIPRLLSAVELVAVPSVHREAGPFSAMEAAAAGKPVVIYDIADGSGVVRDGYNGIVVPAGDIKGLAEAVACLLGDREKHERMAEGALLRAKNFDMRAHVKKLACIYRSLI